MESNKNINLTLKHKLFILIFLIIIFTLIGVICLLLQKEEVLISTYKSKYISFNYDNNFQIENEDEQVELKNKDKSAIIIVKKLDYTITSQNKSKDELTSSLSFQVIKEKKDYIELYNNYEEKNNKIYYYYLYENYKENRQVEVITIYDENYIYMIIYSAKSSDFDLYSKSISMIKDSIEG